MKAVKKISLKVFLFCLILISLQIALVEDCMGFVPNLPFATVIVFASLLSLYEACFAALIFMLFISIFSYDSQILWVYPVVAFIGVKLNPNNIDDKFLVTVVYSLVFTPILELFSYSKQAYLVRSLNSSLSTTVTAIILYFIVKAIFETKKVSSYPSLR